MKIDPGSTAIGIVCGAALLAFAVPLGSFMAENVSGLCAAASASLLTGSAWLAFRTRSTTVRPVGFDLHDPQVLPSELLASMGVTEDDPMASRLVEMGLEAQLKTTGIDDPRVEALLLCLLSGAPQDLAINMSRGSRSDMMTRLAEAMMDPDLKSGAVQFMKEYGLREDVRLGEIRDILSERHGTPVTMMLAALEAARSRRASCAPSEFLWLKKVDRRLWYAMSNLGRASFHVEGIAAIAHFREEKIHGRSEAPLIGAAVAALRGECIDPKGSDVEALPAAA